ncbi:type II secretion system protein [Candidatus Saccharibacteria bacterium]|jgi:hypothetical protein|nr:type II secretion system protein [Candidatus Saccharibacteria bacterium]
MRIRKSVSPNAIDGFITPTLLGLIIVLSIVSAATMQLIGLNLAAINTNARSQSAFNIAEAGINYYLWHLSHNPNDHKDGGTLPQTPDPVLGYGPYTHSYIDDNSKTAGTYTLWVKPESGGSTVVNLRSIGKTSDGESIRTIDAKVGSPSFASYAVASDTALWFGDTETATGPIHSNQGIRMDGANTSDVTAASATYVPSTSLGGNGSSKPGVWCSATITTPVNCNTRPKSDWRFPVPSIDFNQISANLCSLKKTAFSSSSNTASLANLSNACTQTPNTLTSSYLPQRSTNGSYNNTRGYLIELNNNSTYNLSQVNNETDTNTIYTSALSRNLIANNIPIPSSGIIFAEDNVWIRSNPTFSGRVTIGAGRLASSNNARISIADDLIYSTKTGQDVIGLVSESNVTIAPYAPPLSGDFNFEINAAIISQNGSVNYPSNYQSNTSLCTQGWSGSNQRFTFYGSIASRNSWTWTWSRNSSCNRAVSVGGGKYVSGILNNDTQYDYSLLYQPPPSFPITSTYNVLSWKEVLTIP